MSMQPSLEARFRAQVASVGATPGDAWVVAVSGGLDSVVLLHLLRFAAPDGVRLIAAHFDHAMRPESADDARWVHGLARAWGVDACESRAQAAITSEAEAREVRYAYLETVRVESGARLVLTAHHADDQAETVLFRALRNRSGGFGGHGLCARHHLPPAALHVAVRVGGLRAVARTLVAGRRDEREPGLCSQRASPERAS